MADAGKEAGKQLSEITECSICMSTFTDPRILSCIHTFCFQCLKRTAETAQKRPGDKIPCPLCRKEFIIPTEGITGMQKNFFMESLLSFRTTLQMGSVSITCDICSASDEGKTGKIPLATMKCVQCRDNYCESCIKVHKFQKPNKHHQVLKIGDDTFSDIKQISSAKFCTQHAQKPLDYYCADCKKIVCVSCFVENHQSHDCKDITTVDAGFSKTIGKKIWKMSTYVDEIMSIRKSTQKGQAEYLKKLAETEIAISKRNEDLKDMIDRHTKTLLDELSELKSDHVKQIESRMEEIDGFCTILTSFKAYCTELMSKGSPSDICSSIDQLILRGDELDRDHIAFISRSQQTSEVYFEIADLTELYFLQKSNSMVGKLQGKSETTSQFDDHAVIVGLDDGANITTDVINVNLSHRSKEISAKEQIPTTAMTLPVVASVFHNTMYVTGTGVKTDEIWRYNENTGWIQCGSLVQGRRRHSATFIEEVLYICGGYVDANESVLDSVHGRL